MIPVDADAQRRLYDLDLLAHLDEDGKRNLIASFWMSDFAPGQPVLTEGDANTRLYATVTGRLTVRLPARRIRSESLTITHLEPGQMFGEFSLYDAAPVSATVVAETSARVAWIEKSAIDAFVEGHPAAGRKMYDNLVRNLIRRLRANNARLELETIG